MSLCFDFQNETIRQDVIFGTMIERRGVLLILIGLMVCISLWRISIQDPEYTIEYTSIPAMNIEMVNVETMYDTPTQNVSIVNTLRSIPDDDVKKLIDINNFEYSLNQSGCSSETAALQPIAIFLIHSAPLNRAKRHVIRDTWGKMDSRARLYFLIGAVNSTALQTQIEQENRLHNDIIQGSFTDAYHNMTYKHIMAFKWFIYNCPKVKYLVKTDDDVFVNTPYIFEYLETKADAQNFLFCYKVENSRIKRTYRSKWRVSPKEFPGRYYPPYCPGFSIIYSGDVVWKLYNEAQQSKYFWIDDVHITGTLAQKVNLNITAMGKMYLTGEPLKQIFDGNFNETNTEFIFANADLVENEIRSLWYAVLYTSNVNSTNLK